MSKRKAIPKSVRFEVFKRDGFTCQYCGAKAPDVVLQLDHIVAVAAGGDDGMMNLATSCSACNGGKGARALDDNSVVAKQRAQMDALHERREQLEMLIRWRDGLNSIADDQVTAFKSQFEADTGLCLESDMCRNVRLWIKRDGLQPVLSAWDTSSSLYLKWESGELDGESVHKALNYVPRILRMAPLFKEKPYLNDLFYVRGILRNRIVGLDEQACIDVLENAHLAGCEAEELKEYARMSSTWPEFMQCISDAMLAIEYQNSRQR